MIIPLSVLICSVLSVFGDSVAERKCDRNDDTWVELVPEDPTFYYYCSPRGTVELTSCPVVQGRKKIFDKTTRQCLFPSSVNRKKRQPGSSASGSVPVGGVCRTNTDCMDGAYCGNSGLCGCYTTFVQIDTYCYAKFNPQQAGCTYQAQCDSVWPGSTCTSNVCQCQANVAPSYTLDGPVCAVNNQCPTNNANPILRTPDGIGFDTCQVQSLPGATYLALCQGGTYYVGTYDCIISSLNYDATGATTGYCCPSRAFTCIQQLDAGTSSASIGIQTRYFYNSITQSCTQFSYLGSGGNANNFISIQQCQSYCTTICKRGPPQYSSVVVAADSGKIQYCSSAGTVSSGSGCGTNFQCDSVGSQSICCPTPSFVCGPQGGISVSTPSSPDTGNGQKGYSRYYWNSNTGQCASFVYGGQGGTFNNFLTLSDCQQFCSTSLCPYGTPLKDSSNINNLQCSGSGTTSQCPVTHYCNNNVCCATKQTVCTQPKLVGTCGSFATKYWFNAQSGTCEQFTYSGCQGNANNFNSFLDCNTFCQNIGREPQCVQGVALRDTNGNFYQCQTVSGSFTGAITTSITVCPTNYQCYFDGFTYGCCPQQGTSCSLGYDQGTQCGPTTSRWYFDPTRLTCSTFTYLGCDGNANNFAIQRDCQNYCGVGACPDGGTPLNSNGGVPQYCAGAVGSGSNSFTSCPTTHACTAVTISSTFGTTSQISVCCPLKATTCSQPVDPGATCGSGSLTRYFYNTASRACTSFAFNGCGGNNNNFATLQACINYCSSAACPAGQIAYVNGGTVQTCSIGVANACPSGYSCVFDSINVQNVCCGTSDNNACPSGEQPYMSALTQAAQQCTANTVNSCPGNYLCRYNVARNLYLCCQPAITGSCPVGSTPYVFPGTTQPVSCTLGVVNSCSQVGYTCQAGTTNTQLGYCCSTSSSNCPNGGQPYLLSNQLVTCSPSNPLVCPQPQYSCAQSPTQPGAYYCCTGAPSVVCGNGGQPLISNGQVISCQAGAFNACPNPYQCTPSLGTGTGLNYCCTAGTSVSNVCPNGSPQLINNQPTSCQQGGFNTCQAGYTCTFTTSGISYCCGGSPVPGYCSSGAPLLTNGVPITCQPNLPGNCPSGYSCTLGGVGISIYYCCSGVNVNTQQYCSSGTPYLNNGIPAACSPGSFNTCPTSYSCTSGVTPGSYFCCLGGIVTPVNSGCPNNLQPLVINGQQQTCSPSFGSFGSSSCSPGYYCQYVAAQSRYICCGNAQLAVTTTAVPYCPSGPVALSFGGIANQCSGGSCQQGYTCTPVGAQQLCCPTPTFACTANLDAGTSCNGISSTTAYYYNTQTKQCTQFTYNGCGGGANNFQTFASCQSACSNIATCNVGRALTDSFGNPQTCSGSSCQSGYTCQQSSSGTSICCPAASTVCTQPQQTGGNCGSTSQTTRYYFNPSSVSCQIFTYAGCGGNDNNFANINDCQNLCVQGACPAGSPLLNGNQPQTCAISFGNSCQSGYDCVSSKYGSGQQICCPSKSNVCNQPLNQGSFCSSGGQQTRYYYTNGVCQSFTFLGCGGGLNNFGTLQDCQSYCSGLTNPVNPVVPVTGGLCPNGQQPYANPFTRAPLACTIGSNNCPAGYTCSQVGFSAGCCLGSPFNNPFPSTANVCPSVLAPVTGPNGQPRTCTPGFFSSCPAPSQCFNGPAGTNTYYCCQARSFGMFRSADVGDKKNVTTSNTLKCGNGKVIGGKNGTVAC